VAGIALSESADWQPLSLFVLLLAVAVVSETFRLQAKHLNISAAFLAISLGMVLLGPAPAALLGVLTVVVSDLQKASPWRSRLVNASTYAFFPLIGGVIFEALGGHQLLEENPPVYILLVFGLFLASPSTSRLSSASASGTWSAPCTSPSYRSSSPRGC
jgi:hypothetical protein